MTKSNTGEDYVIHKLLLLTFTLLSISCGNTTPSNPPIPAFDYSYTTYGTGSKRIFLIHGLNGSRSDYTSGALAELRNGLVTQGYQVITFDTPTTKAYFFDDGGYVYRRNFINFINWIVADTDEKLGKADERVIGGFSFGGLHSMIAASSTNHFDKYTAIMSLVRIPSLGGFTNVSAPAFDPFNELDNLSQTKGLITWSNQDTIVDYRYSIMLQNQLQSSTIGIEYSINHQVSSEQVVDILQWIGR